MPSYYDSKKKQPGKAEVKYKKGGKVKYDKGGTVTKSVKSKANLRQQEIQDRKKALIESLKRKSKPLPKVKLPTVTVEELDGGELEEVIVSKKKSARPKPRRPSKKREAERLLPHHYFDKDGKPIPKMESNPRKRNWVVDKDGKPLPKGNSNVKQLLSKGGQLKVTGMGAATRGGNFTRNG